MLHLSEEDASTELPVLDELSTENSVGDGSLNAQLDVGVLLPEDIDGLGADVVHDVELVVAALDDTTVHGTGVLDGLIDGLSDGLGGVGGGHGVLVLLRKRDVVVLDVEGGLLPGELLGELLDVLVHALVVVDGSAIIESTGDEHLVGVLLLGWTSTAETYLEEAGNEALGEESVALVVHDTGEKGVQALDIRLVDGTNGLEMDGERGGSYADLVVGGGSVDGVLSLVEDGGEEDAVDDVGGGLTIDGAEGGGAL